MMGTSTGLALPTPAPTPPPETASKMETPPSLSARINTATRTQHTNLNRLITTRLPLALPPHTTTPHLYAKGILPFARLFLFFETEWSLLSHQLTLQTTTTTGQDSHYTQIRTHLSTLRPPHLARTPRIQSDLLHLRDITDHTMYTTAELDPSWTESLRAKIRSRPHILIAFAWVLYMAVFSGGRWVRGELMGAGVAFWTGNVGREEMLVEEKGVVREVDEMPGLGVFSFDAEDDGVGVKEEFKRRLVEVEGLLDEEEKVEVIETAGEIFERCIAIVQDLDRVVWKERVTTLLWSSVRPGMVFVLAVLCFLALRYLAWL